jgi:chemotaxis protein methyltransferase CheR
MTDEEYQVLKVKVLKLTGIDFDSYKSQQMRRRLAFFIEKSNGMDVAAYCRKLETENDSLVKLRDFITINVTEFFRDEWAFTELENNILPALLRIKRTLRVWSAGCSNGGEPYSLAILLKTITGSSLHKILATDVDELSLAKAAAGGPYGADSVKGVPEQHVKQYFTSTAGDNLWVRPEIRNMVRFQKHNMLSEPFEQGFDLVCCRNVTIYFTDEAKNKLNQQIHGSLNNSGVLFTGSTEFIHNATALGFNKLSNCFYQKGAVPASVDRLVKGPLLQTARR